MTWPVQVCVCVCVCGWCVVVLATVAVFIPMRGAPALSARESGEGAGRGTTTHFVLVLERTCTDSSSSNHCMAYGSRAPIEAYTGLPFRLLLCSPFSCCCALNNSSHAFTRIHSHAFRMPIRRPPLEQVNMLAQNLDENSACTFETSSDGGNTWDEILTIGNGQDKYVLQCSSPGITYSSPA